MIRERFSGDLKQAVLDQDAGRAATLRLICAAIRSLDTARSGDGTAPDDVEVLAILGRMVRQREESARFYEESGRLALAEDERREIGIIRAYLPREMTETEVRQAVDAAIADTQAGSIRDLATIMAHLKARYSGRMDFARACLAVKQAFG